MTQEIDPALVERMVKLVRGLAQYVPQLCAEVAQARAIVAELPAPVDPDLLLAREVAATHPYAGQFPPADYVARIQAGDNDQWDCVQVALAAIKRVRQQEAG